MPAAFKPDEFYAADQAQNILAMWANRIKAFRRGRAQQKCAERATNQNKWERNHDSLQAGLLHLLSRKT